MNKITKGDILGIVDYLMDGPYVDNYKLYDNWDEFNVWIKTCVDWLNKEANKLEGIMSEFEWIDYNNMNNVEKINTILNSNLHEDLRERVQLEQTIVDCSKYVWGDNSTEYVVGLLSSVVTKSQLEVLANNLKNKIKTGETK